MKKNNTNKEYCYLNWTGKENCVQEVQNITNKKLFPIKNKSINFDTTENIYIEGDNLDALKLLQKNYANKIRVIYIDPPYNTGKDFVYKDNLKHSNWCSMIFPRLLLAKNLLCNNGIIFISIDDKEIANLKNICQEIFGEENFITQFIYEKTQHFGRQKFNAYSNAEYILCYAKALNDKSLKELLVERIKNDLEDAPLFNASNNITTLNFPAKTVKFSVKDGIYSSTSSNVYKLITPVIVKNGTNENNLSMEFKSRWSQEKVIEEIKKGTKFWVKSENFAIRAIYSKQKTTTIAPKQIIFTNKSNKFCTISRFGKAVSTNETATKEVQNLIEGVKFSYPKPVTLIEYLISLIYDSEKHEFPNDFMVLDFFSGAGTTAHAVMNLNNYDNGTRKFILVQKPELLKNDSEAYKFGFKTLCDLGEERIRQACMKLRENYPNSKFDSGFKVYKISD